jgi:hypothetical protein
MARIARDQAATESTIIRHARAALKAGLHERLPRTKRAAIGLRLLVDRELAANIEA